uniref:Uncharacterized protein n=1 Tax=Panagrolaimus superbus TaxID=310955 RepID=A0A914YM21_9BILA
MVPRHDPGTAAEIHRLELVQPGAFPVFVFDRAEAAIAPVQFRVEGFQCGQQQQRIAVGGEQRAQHQGVPQRRFTHAGFEDGLFVAGVGFGIEQGHGQCADVLQRIFIAGLGGFGAAQGQFQERHGGGDSRGKGGHARPSGRLRIA